jgi:hypothetical protein
VDIQYTYDCKLNSQLCCLYCYVSSLNKAFELRFVYDDYTSSYINLLQKALVPSLQIRRIRTMALETYKIVNKLAPVCLHDLVNVKNSKYAFRYSNILDLPQVRTTRYGKNHSCLQLQLRGTTFRTISELKTVSTTLKV